MNILAIVKASEEKKRKLYQAQLVLTKKTACPLK